MSIATKISVKTKEAGESISICLQAKCYNSALLETLDLVDGLRHFAQRIISKAAANGIEINDRRLMTVEEMREEIKNKEKK